MPLKLLLAIDFQTKSSYILPMIKLSYELKNILEYMAIGIRFKSIELLRIFFQNSLLIPVNTTKTN